MFAVLNHRCLQVILKYLKGALRGRYFKLEVRGVLLDFVSFEDFPNSMRNSVS
jgi:hypothetical protein